MPCVGTKKLVGSGCASRNPKEHCLHIHFTREQQNNFVTHWAWAEQTNRRPIEQGSLGIGNKSVASQAKARKVSKGIAACGMTVELVLRAVARRVK